MNSKGIRLRRWANVYILDFSVPFIDTHLYIMAGKSCTHCFKALADTSRLRILRLLQQSPKTVTEITKQMELTQPTISHHLQILLSKGVIARAQTGRQVVYTYNTAHPSVGCGVFSAPIKP